MTTDKLIEILEEEGLSVSLEKQDRYPYEEMGAEVEGYTNGGVNMVMYISPFNVKEVVERFNDFDIDNEIEVNRQLAGYRNTFTIRESLDDFTEWKKQLDEIVERLKETETE